MSDRIRERKRFGIRKILLAFFGVSLFLFTGCSGKRCQVSFKGIDIYGSYELDLTKEEYAEKGYELGDAFRVKYRAEDGSLQVLEDIPCVSAYGVERGMVILIAYPTDDCIKIARCDEELNDVVKLPKEGTAVTLTLTEKGKYKELNDIINIKVSEKREDYESDEAYVNYRDVTVGNIKPGRLSRSSSPVNDKFHRAETTAKTTIAHNVTTYVNLSEDRETAEKNYDRLPEVCKRIFDEYPTIYVHLLPYYESGETVRGLISLFHEMSEADPGFHLYCVEGRDRTGYVSALLGALCGASYDELVEDYMKSYENFYRVDKEKDKTTYDYYVDVKFTEHLSVFTGCSTVSELKKADLSSAAKAYLLRIGVPEEEIDAVIKKLTE